MNLLCFNHKYPLTCVVEGQEFKKGLWGKVNRLEITCRCPGCGMRLVYSFKIERYIKRGH